MITAYKGIGPERGRTVPVSDALSYAMERCGVRPSAAPADPRDRDEFNLMLVDWFYSGNWIPVEQGDEQEAADSWAS